MAATTAPSPFKLRRHRQGDLGTVADIMATCNIHDTLSRYMTRDIFKLWTSYQLGCYKFIRFMTEGRGRYTFVAVAPDPHEPAKEQVVGFVIYSRHGKSVTARTWQDRPDAQNGLFWALERGLTWAEGKYGDVFTGSNPSKHHEHWQITASEMDDTFPEDLLPEMWEVDLLFVHVDFQRRGIGKSLLQWGFQRAQEENVPLGVKGSPIGGLTYRATGFQSVGGTRFGDWFDELEYGGEEMQFWLWMPEGCPDGLVERVRQRREEELRKRRQGQ